MPSLGRPGLSGMAGAAVQAQYPPGPSPSTRWRRLPMTLDAGTRCLVSRKDLRALRRTPDPDAPAARALADGEARLSVDRFALTANNVTYAALGEPWKYWQFFPSGDADWGCVPVWGFARVTESRADGVAVGTRLYGYLPMGSHLVVQPARVTAAGFHDASGHRADLAAVYNHYADCAADPAHDPAREGWQALLRPLFSTAFLLDDALAEAGFHGAGRLVLSSASSKTAWCTAFCLAQRPDRPRLIGLTSGPHVAATQAMGLYDEVVSYETLGALDRAEPAAYLDFSGRAALRQAVHQHFGEALRASVAIGATHWEALGGSRSLPGPKPEAFFAPGRAALRNGPPPGGWGREGFARRLGEAWRALLGAAASAEPRWLDVREAVGADAVDAAWRALVDGRVEPQVGLVLRP